MDDKDKLPIRIVKSKQSPETIGGGGGKYKVFLKEEELLDQQHSLITDIDNAKKYFQKSFQKYPKIPHVLKVQLINKAIAKSHRPSYLFSTETCPVIGGGSFGELYVRTGPQKISYLREKIEEIPSAKTSKNKWKANVSAVSNLNPFNEYDRLHGETSSSLYDLLEKHKRRIIKAKLFNFFDDEVNKYVKKNFIRLINQLHLNVNIIGEDTNLNIWKVEEIDIESLRELVKFPAIKELSLFPKYEIHHSSIEKTASSILVPSPESKDYPIVGLLDTGIPSKHLLSPWIINSYNFVPPSLSNHFHGCRVGALLIMADYINSRNTNSQSSLDIDNGNLKIIDVEILGNTNEDNGEKDDLYEDGFIKRLENCFKEIDTIPRIWNMSLGFNENLCDLKRFSDISIFLDKLQDRYNILLVLPSGNYENTPYRTWPPNIEDIDFDHIIENRDMPPDFLCKPADCIRAITVGAIACDEKKTSIVKRNQPTNYSRKGPGPSFIPKPEVTHYSGNLSILKNGDTNCEEQGIKSIDEKGGVVDCIGTSYSTPLVTRTLALLSHSIEPEPSLLLLKAFLIHNTKMLESFNNYENNFYYVGFGLPEKTTNILFCSPYEITLIFEDKIPPKMKLEYPFPWPNSLRIKNKIKGEVKATLVAKPPLNEVFGAEYIRANVKFSLQSKITRDSKEEWKSIIQENPQKVTIEDSEGNKLINEFLKWIPIKKYYAKIPRGKKSEELRIKITAHLRDGPDMEDFGDEIPFVLILTLKDHEMKLPIYDEVVSNLRSLGIITEGIRLKGRIREIIR